MKTITKRARVVAMTSLVIALSLMSFTIIRGGFGYTIHVNGKLAGEYYISSKHETPTILLSDQDLKGSMTVFFNECGEIGQARKLSLRGANQNVLKEWSFGNGATKHDPMEVVVREMASLNASGKSALYYSSARVDKPQILAYVVMPAKPKIASR